MPRPMNPADLSFGDVEAILADVHGIASAKRTAFQARLKNMLRLGFPGYEGSGRGKRGRFGAFDLATLAVAVELSQLGLAPAHATKVMIDHWGTVSEAVMRSMTASMEGPALLDENLPPAIIFFDPAALWPLMDDVLPNDVDYASASLELMTDWGSFETMKERTSGACYRIAAINVSALVARLAAAFPSEGNFFEGFLYELSAAAGDEVRRHYDRHLRAE